MDDLSIAIGKNIVRLRKAKNMKQCQLAEALETDPCTVHHWEYGHSSPSAYSLCLLADALDCTVDELLGRC